MESPSLVEAAWPQIQAFLTASGSPHRAGDHFDRLSPDALLLLANRVERCKDVTRDQFIAVWRFWAQKPSKLWGPQFQPVELLGGREEGPTVCIWARIREKDSRRTVTAAFTLDRETLLLRGACLTDDQALTADQLEARACAEFANVATDVSPTSIAQSGLALAFDRLYGTESLPFLTLPEARFSCQGRGDCCRTFHAPANRHAEKAVTAMAWDRLGGQPPVFGAFLAGQDQHGLTPDFALETDGQGGCKALVDGGCSVHAQLGWQPIEACQFFPYQMIQTPDGIVVTSMFTCLTVGDNVGELVSSQSAELHQRLRPFRERLPKIPAEVPLRDNGPLLPWKAYRRLETFLLATLADASLGSVRERLNVAHVAVTMLVHQAGTAKRVADADVAKLLTTVEPSATAMSSEFADTMLAQLFQTGILLQESGSLLDGLPQAWQQTRGRDLSDACDDELLTRFLRTVLFRKRGLAAAGVTFLWGSVSLMAALYERETLYRHDVTGRPIDRALQMETAKRIDTALQHTPLLQTLASVPALRLRLADPRSWFSLQVT